MPSPDSPDDASGPSRRRFLGAAAAAATAGLAGCTTPFLSIETTERTVERRFDAAPLERLRVDEATDDVRVEAAAGDTVRVRARKRAHGGTSLSELSLDARTEDGTLHLETTKPTVVGIGGGSVDLELAVPESVAVERVATADGDVVADAVSGDLEATSGDGNVTVRRAGAVTARTGDGDVTVRDPDAVEAVDAGDGDVDAVVPSVDGSATVGTGDGDVRVALGEALDATVEVTTGDGDIVVAGGLDEVRTRTEHRVVGTAADGTNQLTVHTGDGDVRLESA